MNTNNLQCEDIRITPVRKFAHNLDSSFEKTAEIKGKNAKTLITIRTFCGEPVTKNLWASVWLVQSTTEVESRDHVRVVQCG